MTVIRAQVFLLCAFWLGTAGESNGAEYDFCYWWSDATLVRVDGDGDTRRYSFAHEIHRFGEDDAFGMVAVQTSEQGTLLPLDDFVPASTFCEEGAP